MKTKSLSILILILLCTSLAFFMSPTLATGESKEEEREDARRMAKDTLSRLYAHQPKAKHAVQNAAGYATFSNFGMKILLAGGGRGSGVAVNNKTKAETFMKMAELQAGLGIGIKKFRVVFVFENYGVFDEFVNSGWEFGGQATAAAKLGDEGGAFAGAMSIKPGVWMYQLTDDGLALELTAKGTKYYKDKDLN
jgi:lipid-binding SYLF domain-containing protein